MITQASKQIGSRVPRAGLPMDMFDLLDGQGRDGPVGVMGPRHLRQGSSLHLRSVRGSRTLKIFGSGSKTRTCDPRINSPLLYRLSYAGTRKALQNSSKGPPRQGMLRRKPDPAGVYSRSVCATSYRSFRSIECRSPSEYSIRRMRGSPAIMAEHLRPSVGRYRQMTGTRKWYRAAAIS